MASNGKSGSGSGGKSGSGSSGSSSRSRSSGSSSRSRSSSGGSRSRSSSRSGGSRNGKAKPAELARAARAQLSELTGRPAESVLGIRQDDDGWSVMVEVVELSRVPNSTDLLGCYVATLDDDGDLVAYERVRRYQRGQAGGEQQ